MSTIDASAVGQPHGHGEDNYLTAGRGILSWMLTLDHKRIGVMYMVGILGFFLAGGIFALLVRTTLLIPQKGADFLIQPDMYNMYFTLHGAIMVFIVIIPGIPAAIGNFVLPLMIGAKDVAFPRLNLASWYMWAFGCLFMLTSIIFGGVDTGWTFYTPYSTGGGNPAMAGVIPVLFGAFLLGFSSIFTAVNFITTIHKMRPPTMGWFKMPLLMWALYATAIIQVLATPVLGITLLLLLVERTFQIGIFNPGLGGDPIMYQHFFWFYSHPAVYIMILPAMGVISETISIYSRRHIFGYKFIAFSSVAIAIFGFLVWGHHMFVSGQSTLIAMIFSGLTFSVAIPSAIKVFNWLATMWKGAISLRTPMIYTLSFIWIFGIGGLTGLYLGMLAIDVQVHDTYFVVAHFHFTMAATIFVFFGAIYHWWPKITGLMYEETIAQWGAWLSVIGFNITFLAQFPMGSLGMPRRYFNYPIEFFPFHLVSTIGAWMAGIGFVIAILALVHSLILRRKAPASPWGGASMEWETTSPPPLHNFHELPPVRDPYDFNVLDYKPDTDEYVFKQEPARAPVHG